MSKVLYICLFIILSNVVFANNNIYQFDEKTDVIITTSVYKNGIPTENATCNLTVFNPPPNENSVNLSVYLENKGNGIFTYNLTGNLSYSQEIYPITLYCNDTDGTVGFDDRVGIKIGEKLYDYIIPGAIILVIAFIFIYISFKVDEQAKELKLLMFYLGLTFVLSSLFYGLSVVDQIPFGSSFNVIFVTLISIFILIIILMVFLQWTDKLEDAVKTLTGSK